MKNYILFMKPSYLKSILFYSTILALFAITACKKEDEPTKSALLSKEWKIISVDGETVNEYFEEDEIFLKFEIGGVFKITWVYDGDSEIESGNWNWENNEVFIKVDLDGDVVNWELKKLTKTEFWFFDTDEDALFKCIPR